MPATLDIWGAGTSDAQLAQALLAAGIINDDEDWNGDLHESLQAGLTRWVNVVCDAQNVWGIHVEVAITTDVGQWGVYDADWVEEFKGQPSPLGAVVIESTGFDYVYVEQAVRAWEAKQKGLGFALLDLVQFSFARTIGAVSPLWALGYLQDAVDGWEDENEETDPLGVLAEDDGFITSLKLQRTLPVEIYGDRPYEFLDGALAKGMRKRSLSPEEQILLQDAQDLLNAVGAAQQDPAFGDQHYCFGDHEQVQPVGIRWNSDDRIPEVSDYFHDSLSNSGTGSSFVWLRGFQFGSPDQTPAVAFQQVRTCLRLVALTSQILRRLSGDGTPLPPKKRKRRGTPLAQIFLEEAADPPLARRRPAPISL